LKQRQKVAEIAFAGQTFWAIFARFLYHSHVSTHIIFSCRLLKSC